MLPERNFIGFSCCTVIGAGIAMGAMFARGIGGSGNPGDGTHRGSLQAVAVTVYISRYMRTGVFGRGM
jgi:hypothetical protein